jgi:hypothetical protein
MVTNSRLLSAMRLQLLWLALSSLLYSSVPHIAHIAAHADGGDVSESHSLGLLRSNHVSTGSPHSHQHHHSHHPQQHRRRLRQSKTSSCKSGYSVYVYPIAHSLQERAEDARANFKYHVCKKCIYEQFALEYIIYDYFTQFCGRTLFPEEAGTIYVLMLSDAHLQLTYLWCRLLLSADRS